MYVWVGFRGNSRYAIFNRTDSIIFGIIHKSAIYVSFSFTLQKTSVAEVVEVYNSILQTFRPGIVTALFLDAWSFISTDRVNLSLLLSTSGDDAQTLEQRPSPPSWWPGFPSP